MIIVALFGALIFYVALYCLWASANQHLVGVAGWMHVLNDMIWMPGHLVFVLLRGLILVTALYVFADCLRSGVAKWRRVKTEKKRAREEPFAIVSKHISPR